jgi:NADPH-dependent 7-cyano-7-deazaguanine reductase QueF
MVELSENDLRVQPNEHRCAFTEHEHRLEISNICPVTGNPNHGSRIYISYKGYKGFLEVASLRRFVDSYRGGKGEVRSMEGMLQEIAQSCADVLGVDVKLVGDLIISPAQNLKVTCYAFPKGIPDEAV